MLKFQHHVVVNPVQNVLDVATNHVAFVMVRQSCICDNHLHHQQHPLVMILPLPPQVDLVHRHRRYQLWQWKSSSKPLTLRHVPFVKMAMKCVGVVKVPVGSPVGLIGKNRRIKKIKKKKERERILQLQQRSFSQKKRCGSSFKQYFILIIVITEQRSSFNSLCAST